MISILFFPLFVFNRHEPPPRCTKVPHTHTINTLTQSFSHCNTHWHTCEQTLDRRLSGFINFEKVTRVARRETWDNSMGSLRLSLSFEHLVPTLLHLTHTQGHAQLYGGKGDEGIISLHGNFYFDLTIKYLSVKSTQMFESLSGSVSFSTSRIPFTFSWFCFFFLKTFKFKFLLK